MAMRDAAPARTFGSNGGHLGTMIDAFDWSATALGPIGRWPAAMRTVVELVLRSPAPIATLWGREGVMIYNDGYAAIAASRHPAMLGMPVCEAWPEVADFNANVLDVVLKGGTLSCREQPMTLVRDGMAAQCWFDLDYSPVVGEDGDVLGVMAVVAESTAKVRAEAGLDVEHSRLRAIFQQAPGFVAQLTGPDHVFALVNATYSALIGARPVIGRPVRLALPETVPQGFVDQLDHVYRSGEPCAATGAPLWLSDGGNQRRLYYIDFVYQPLRGEDGSVTGVFVQGHDVTGRVLADHARRASDARFIGFAEAIPHQVWSATADGKNDWFNHHAYAYSGLGFEQLGGTGWTAIVHPDDLARVTTRWAIAVASGATYEAEMRLRARDGCYRWHLCRAVALRGEDGEVSAWVGTNTDIEDRKQAERRLEQLNAGLEQQGAERTAKACAGAGARTGSAARTAAGACGPGPRRPASGSATRQGRGGAE
jgi:PAS domain S-box-containing protein